MYPSFWSYYGGGAIRAYESDLVITQSTFENNRTQAGNGGAIFIDDRYTGHQLEIDSSTFIDNHAYGAGGAVRGLDARRLRLPIVYSRGMFLVAVLAAQ